LMIAVRGTERAYRYPYARLIFASTVALPRVNGVKLSI
jgi:hypothetical protein